MRARGPGPRTDTAFSLGEDRHGSAQLNHRWYVAALGLVPPAPVLQAIDTILDRGEPADLPTDVWHALQERRHQATRLGPWVERHHRQNEPRSSCPAW